MTQDELIAVGMLRGVSFGTGSPYDRRAASHLFSLVEPPKQVECNCGLDVPRDNPKTLEFPSIAEQRTAHLESCPVVIASKWQPMITEKMAPQLWRILFRYRRQIKHPERVKYLLMAEKLMVPEYRSYEYRKAQEASYKIAKMKREAAEKEVV
jgi:hypothetical protein